VIQITSAVECAQMDKFYTRRPLNQVVPQSTDSTGYGQPIQRHTLHDTRLPCIQKAVSV
jgi:hypothetical protein